MNIVTRYIIYYLVCISGSVYTLQRMLSPALHGGDFLECYYYYSISVTLVGFAPLLLIINWGKVLKGDHIRFALVFIAGLIYWNYSLELVPRNTALLYILVHELLTQSALIDRLTLMALELIGYIVGICAIVSVSNFFSLGEE